MKDERWLVLAHQLPARPSNARVKTWRRLQQVGAIPTRNSVYVLPNTDQCREDFEWLRSEIVSRGGEATVFAADIVDDRSGDELIAGFRRAREADYRDLKRDADQLLSAVRRGRVPSRPGRARVARSMRGLRERLAEIERIDYFNAP